MPTNCRKEIQNHLHRLLPEILPRLRQAAAGKQGKTLRGISEAIIPGWIAGEAGTAEQLNRIARKLCGDRISTSGDGRPVVPAEADIAAVCLWLRTGEPQQLSKAVKDTEKRTGPKIQRSLFA